MQTPQKPHPELDEKPFLFRQYAYFSIALMILSAIALACVRLALY